MTLVLRFRVEKLIRDKLPQIMRASGLTVFDRQLDGNEFIRCLKLKLVEEAAEAVAADTPAEVLAELADVLEVILALTQASGFSPADLETARLTKLEQRGGFADRVYNAAVEANEACPALTYYTERPEQYPQVV